MNPFEYISLLTSIVLALGITRTLSGLGAMLNHRRRVHLYWVHLVWCLNVFLWLLLNWWILYRWHLQETWSFFLFVFVLLSPIIAFLLSVLLIPEPMPEGTDLRKHYFGNHRWFFGLASLLPPIDATDTLLKGWSHFLAQGTVYPVSLFVWFILMVIAAVTPNERYHATFSIFFLIYLLVFISINLRLLV
jgi:hypothetical protein